MTRFEVRIWEKAEHRVLDVVIEAENERDAWAKAQKEYPRRSYIIRNVHPIV
jgi:hypothetical protein